MKIDPTNYYIQQSSTSQLVRPNGVEKYLQTQSLVSSFAGSGIARLDVVLPNAKNPPTRLLSRRVQRLWAVFDASAVVVDGDKNSYEFAITTFADDKSKLVCSFPSATNFRFCELDVNCVVKDGKADVTFKSKGDILNHKGIEQYGNPVITAVDSSRLQLTVTGPGRFNFFDWIDIMVITKETRVSNKKATTSKPSSGSKPTTTIAAAAATTAATTTAAATTAAVIPVSANDFLSTITVQTITDNTSKSSPIQLKVDSQSITVNLPTVSGGSVVQPLGIMLPNYNNDVSATFPEGKIVVEVPKAATGVVINGVTVDPALQVEPIPQGRADNSGPNNRVEFVDNVVTVGTLQIQAFGKSVAISEDNQVKYQVMDREDLLVHVDKDNLRDLIGEQEAGIIVASLYWTFIYLFFIFYFNFLFLWI